MSRFPGESNMPNMDKSSTLIQSEKETTFDSEDS